MTGSELQAVVLPEGAIQLEWSEPAGDSSSGLTAASMALQQEIFARYEAEPDNWLLALGFRSKTIPLAPSLAFWRNFAGLFARRLRLTPEFEQLRAKVRIRADAEDLAELLSGLPPMTGGEYVDVPLLTSLWEGLNLAFANRLSAWPGTVAELLKGYSPDVHLVGRIYFHLVENRQAELPFAFLATYSAGLNAQGEARHLPLKHALREYGGNSRKLLELLVTVQEAAGKSRLVRELLASGEIFHPLAWSAREAYQFLTEIPLYEDSGILCRIPNWWKARGATVNLSISVGNQAPSMVGMKALLDFRPRLILGDAEISEEEARRLLAESEGLAFIKNKWVAVDPEKLRQTLAAYEKARKMASGDGISILEAMRLAINPQGLAGGGDGAAGDQGVTHGEWLASVFAKMRHPEKIGPVRTGGDFTASLRPYQQQGLQWLFFLHQFRFGACLADDMGLGKTVQVLALLDVLRAGRGQSAEAGKASLLIIPASLIANWISELKQFAPRLTYFVAHPDLHRPGPLPELDAEGLDRFDLVITTYALAQRYAWLQAHEWQYVILDEAQAIKNPGTKQSRAIKKLDAANRLIMTGTPIENRLADLWSLFDFLNPGLLGTAKEFSALAKRLATEPAQGYSGLRRIVSPFILRRLKTDRTIIADLPDKVEVKTWAALSRRQAILYEQMVESLRQTIEAAEGIKRKGLILAALMKFKQLCNHPAQYLGAGDFAEEESGKFARLREICETIHEKREKVLIFTQFQEMTGPLTRFLAGIFGREGLILHGGVAVGKRKELIARFQAPGYVPYLVLSLKAGGVGLNLTAASHVIHFDRWWNPAVENQATDRAFRIGQKKNVMVHKFLTKGTIEEKIDAMLEQKARLSAEVIAATGESWITEMDNKELMELFTCSGVRSPEPGVRRN